MRRWHTLALPSLHRCRSMRSVSVLFLALVLVFARAAQAEIWVDVELVLAADVSRSMTPEEGALQRRGHAEALTSEEVLGAIGRGPTGRIALTYVEWASAGYQRQVVGWTLIETAEDAAGVAGAILEHPSPTIARTSVSATMRYAAGLFDDNGFASARRVIDISGDGPNNEGAPVAAVRDQLVREVIVINGLPITDRAGYGGIYRLQNLDAYFRDCVIGGPGAFVLPVRYWHEFERALRIKLWMEIAGPPARVVPASAQSAIDFDCLIGERLWERSRGRQEGRWDTTLSEGTRRPARVTSRAKGRVLGLPGWNPARPIRSGGLRALGFEQHRSAELPPSTSAADLRTHKVRCRLRDRRGADAGDQTAPDVRADLLETGPLDGSLHPPSLIRRPGRVSRCRVVEANPSRTMGIGWSPARLRSGGRPGALGPTARGTCPVACPDTGPAEPLPRRGDRARASRKTGGPRHGHLVDHLPHLRGRADQRRDLLRSGRGEDRHRALAPPLQHEAPARIASVSATGSRGRLVAGCAIRSRFAGHARRGARTCHAPGPKPDHRLQAGRSPPGSPPDIATSILFARAFPVAERPSGGSVRLRHRGGTAPLRAWNPSRQGWHR